MTTMWSLLNTRTAALACLFTVSVTAGTIDRAPAALAQSQQSQTPGVDTTLFSGLRWRSIGPARGGRSIAVGGSARRPSEYYFGATGGGLWKTTDNGLTWRPMSDRFFKSSSVGAVGVAESNPDVVYVGMGEVA